MSVLLTENSSWRRCVTDTDNAFVVCHRQTHPVDSCWKTVNCGLCQTGYRFA